MSEFLRILRRRLIGGAVCFLFCCAYFFGQAYGEHVVRIMQH